MDNTPNEQNTKKWILVCKLFSLTCEPLRSSGVAIHSLLESTFHAYPPIKSTQAQSQARIYTPASHQPCHHSRP
ncbi:hypothetical protein [Helicobacter zhangjianzhongii]|uniref:hypothetical protein n=1 Tax=Helicobacter zhangjianzhongii TaxID=2974574 RepID=UPI0025541E14|nr:hypothetical protein [Helicobacter sp. CPD2-1]MDL0080091.1 hypothetical protein [Helicobacter sp. CPD2-1]